MTQEAYQVGYDTLVFDSYESKENEARIIEKLIGYNVDAIILSVVSSDRFYKPDYFRQLELLNIPVILVDREVDIKHCSGVYIDNLDCGLQAGRFIQSQEAKSVVIVSGPEDSNVARDRVTGLKAALQGSVDKVEILYADFLMDEAYKVTDSYLQKNSALISLSAVITRFLWGSSRLVLSIKFHYVMMFHCLVLMRSLIHQFMVLTSLYLARFARNLLASD